MNRRAGDLNVRALGDELADQRQPSAPGCRPEHRDTVCAALIEQPGMLSDGPFPTWASPSWA